GRRRQRGPRERAPRHGSREPGAADRIERRQPARSRRALGRRSGASGRGGAPARREPAAPLSRAGAAGRRRPPLRELRMMSLLSYFRAQRRQRTASVAKERLQILVAHERAARNGRDWLPKLQDELLAVIKKYVDIDRDAVQMQLDRE